MSEKSELTREKLVFLSNTVRHLQHIAIYLSAELEHLIKWLDQIVKDFEKKEKDSS